MTERGFIGQDAAWHEWMEAILSDRMHHAWLLAGAKGLGKRAFARSAAEALVREQFGEQPHAGSHPDIHIIEPLPANDDESKKKAEGKPFQTKRNVTIDQVRQLQSRLTTRPTLGARRAIVIDTIDELEKGAVNALLKSLEEPPAGTYFLLISHSPGRLLPTIRSRCRVLRFASLSSDEIDAVILRDHPDASQAVRHAAVEAAQGSPGTALSYVEHDLAGIHQLMKRILSEGDRNFTLRGALAAEIGARPSRERQLAVIDLALTALAAALPMASGRQLPQIIDAHGKLSRLEVQAPTFNFDAGLLIMEIGGLLASTAMPRETAR